MSLGNVTSDTITGRVEKKLWTIYLGRIGRLKVQNSAAAEHLDHTLRGKMMAWNLSKVTAKVT